MKCEKCNCNHDSLYGSGRFCSEKCARSFSTKAKRLEINTKISVKLKNGVSWNKGKKLSMKHKANISKKLSIVHKSDNFREALRKANLGKKLSQATKDKISKALKGKTGGYRTNSGTSKFKGSYYNGIWLDSGWELAFVQRLDKINIKWNRESTYFSYIDIEDNKRKYYPDFYLPDFNIYIEIKGYWTDKVKDKLKLVQEQNNFKLIIIDSLDKINNFDNMMLVAA